MKQKARTESQTNLFKTIMRLDGIDDYYDFFEDLCTDTELRSIAQRLEVAKLLSEDKTYAEIRELTGASTVTISRVKTVMANGHGSFEKVFEKKQADELVCEVC